MGPAAVAGLDIYRRFPLCLAGRTQSYGDPKNDWSMVFHRLQELFSRQDLSKYHNYQTACECLPPATFRFVQSL